MKDNLNIYKIWAPDNAMWTEWAKPVLFTGMTEKMKHINAFNIPQISWISKALGDTMIILDLPDKSGVEEALALAKIGFRPVPLYNGVNGPRNNIIKVEELEKALFFGADELALININSDAPPVFMLDSRRLDKWYGEKYGLYDNRWSVFPQDFPSAAFIITQGITKVIVRAQYLSTDLTYVLYNYQQRGIQIYICGDNGNIVETTVYKPLGIKSFFHRFLVTLRLKRNSAGGFGGKIPESSGGGHG